MLEKISNSPSVYLGQLRRIMRKLSQQDHTPQFSIGITGNTGGHTQELWLGIKLAIKDWLEYCTNVPKYQFELLWQEDDFDGEVTTSTAYHFAKKKVSIVLGHLSSSASLLASKIYAENNIPFLAPGSSHPRLTEQGFRNVLRFYGRDDDLAEHIADLCVHLGTHRILLVYQDISYGRSLTAYLKKSLLERGLRVSSNIVFQPHEPSIFERSLAESDSIVFAGTYQKAGELVNFLEQVNYSHPVIFGDDVFIPEFASRIPNRLDNLYVVSTGSNPGDPLYEKFRLKYIAESHGLEPGAYSITSYIAMRSILFNIENLIHKGSTEFIHAVRQWLESDSTPLGRLYFDTKGDISNFPWSVYKIRNHTFIPEKHLRGSL